MIPTWGLVATVKAPVEKVLAFAAHHLTLGATHLWLYFDAPDDPAHAAVADHPQITATLCDESYWNGKTRHDRHQNRQARNARDAYGRCTVDWLGHLDVDEFLHLDRSLAEILSKLPANQMVMKLEPFEAMHDPRLPDDIYAARAFRGALRQEVSLYRDQALANYQTVIRDGLLSHSVGKVFFRRGIRGLSPRLHSVMLNGTRLPAPVWCAGARLLHFHAQDRQAWRDALPFRMTRGAYQYQPPLQAFLEKATAAEIDDFYLTTQVLAPDLSEELQAIGRVIVADLGLRKKVQAIFGPQA